MINEDTVDPTAKPHFVQSVNRHPTKRGGWMGFAEHESPHFSTKGGPSSRFRGRTVESI